MNTLSSTQRQVQGTIRRVLRAIIYCRVSTEKQEQDGASLEFQEEKGHQYAELHGIDVILVLKEVKSGFIHYSLRDQLTIARQMIRDGLADMIIVWDLRRFSRNFVHSAMIFEEIESAGGQIVSVSEHIDNSLTGKLIRSILAWSAESEREKIVEYANRHWQTRLEHNLPISGGRPPYGWQWKDESKTEYILNKEEAAIRLSLFKMFVDLDMSLRGIAHKLTEDGILPPTKSRGTKAECRVWRPPTVRMLLMEVENIGVLRICKTTYVMNEQGKRVRKPNPNMKTIPGGIPRIVETDMYALAQMKLKTNRRDKSHLHQNPEDFLVKGHIFCKSCNYSMHSISQKHRGKLYPFYTCQNKYNKYDACPDLPTIATQRIDQIVWEDCCRVFEYLELVRNTIEYNIKRSLQNLLEETTGKQHIDQLMEEIEFAKKERAKHSEGSYYYTLIAGDIRSKEETLLRYEEEYQKSSNIVKLSNIYQQSTLGFLDFLNDMRGNYHEASFAQKRKALYTLGVRVYLHPDTYEAPFFEPIESEQEWFSIREASELTGIARRTLRNHIKTGNLAAQKRPSTMVHREEFIRFLEVRKPSMHLDIPPDEWFTIHRISMLTGMGYNTICRAIRAGTLQTQEQPVVHPVIHREELNRFLRESPVRPRKEWEKNIKPRVEITYTPIFTGVQIPYV